MINPNIQAKYLDNPDRCPFCNGDNLAGDTPDYSDSKTLVREVECLDCREQWMEVFKLSAMEDNKPAPTNLLDRFRFVDEKHA